MKGIQVEGGSASGFLLNAVEESAIEDRIAAVESEAGPIEVVVFNLGAGLINKMLIQMPVFFVLMPVSILGGFFILAHAIGPILIAYRGVFATWLNAPFQ